METEPSQRRTLMRLMLGSLAGWGLLLAAGAYLGLDPQTPDADVRRAAVVAGALGGFLGLWLVALALRKRR